MDAAEAAEGEPLLLGGYPATRSNEQWAAAIRDAILNGSIAMTSCPLLGLPLMREGPLRPVTLPCCGCFVAHAAAQQLILQRQCHLCRVPLRPDAVPQENGEVAMAVGAEGQGFEPRLFTPPEVAVGHLIGAGAEGTVDRGTAAGEEVAVRKIGLAGAAAATEMAGFRQAVFASYLAGIASPYMCGMRGYYRSHAELRCALRACVFERACRFSRCLAARAGCPVMHGAGAVGTTRLCCVTANGPPNTPVAKRDGGR